MLCCFQPSWTDPQSVCDEQTSSSTTSGYPGQRRDYVKTGGNALAAVPSIAPQLGSQQTSDAPHSSGHGGELVSVTVPDGIVGGQTIHVAHPDGSGRLIQAQVPHGFSTGSIFYVKAPRQQIATSPAVMAIPMAPPVKLPSTLQESSSAYAVAHPIINDYSGVVAMPAPVPFSQCLDQQSETPTSQDTPMGQNVTTPHGSGSIRKLMKVAVPPGALPGSTIHVQVPGENRLIAAQVPPNCAEFHVQYDPLGKEHVEDSLSCASPPAQQHRSMQSFSGGANLLLVKVPPRTAPGTTLHVQVPNEPGRLLSARVPPGNVQEFHVSYQPKTSVAARSHPNDHGQLQHSQSASRPRTEPNNWGPSVLPIAGGVATGIAGAMVYDHFAHHVS